MSRKTATNTAIALSAIRTNAMQAWFPSEHVG
jgi:hypothetical protein